MTDLNRFPLTTKEDVLKSQKEYGGLGGHQCAPIREVIRIQGTSGTTGTPLFIGLTRKDVDLWDEARIFTGSSLFGDGTDAPKISGKLIASRTINGDVLKIIAND